MKDGKRCCDECGGVLEKASLFGGKLLCADCSRDLRQLVDDRDCNYWLLRSRRMNEMAKYIDLTNVLLIAHWVLIALNVLWVLVMLIVRPNLLWLLGLLGALGPLTMIVILLAAREIFDLRKIPRQPEK